MVVTIDQAILGVIAIFSVGQFVVLMLLYWALIVPASKKRGKSDDKGWL
jgi:hypothetical protein